MMKRLTDIPTALLSLPLSIFILLCSLLLSSSAVSYPLLFPPLQDSQEDREADAAKAAIREAKVMIVTIMVMMIMRVGMLTPHA